jgi:hypothetical protein
LLSASGGAFPRAQIAKNALQPEKSMTKLLIRADGAQKKIEVTPVLRGCV